VVFFWAGCQSTNSVKVLNETQSTEPSNFDRVDLIKPVSNVRPYVRTSVRPPKVSSISVKFGM